MNEQMCAGTSEQDCHVCVSVCMCVCVCVCVYLLHGRLPNE